ncbi:hypothetical protein BH23THE1_BH23THE1_12790 [soil metagenome]
MKVIKIPILIIIIGIVSMTLIDTAISSISIYTKDLGKSQLYFYSFFLMAAGYSVGQYFVLNYVKKRIELIKKDNIIRILHTSVSACQILLVSLIIIIIIQMSYLGMYSTIILKIIVWINFILSSILFGYFGIRLLLWEKLNRNSILILFAIGILSLSVTSIITILYVTNQLAGQRGMDYIYPMRSALILVANATNFFSISHLIFSILSFILMWIATVALFNHFSKEIGRVKYWVMVLVPLLYFLSQFQSILPPLFLEFREADPVLYSIIHTLFYNISKPIGGILFGVAIWSIAKKLKKETIRQYITVSACGIILYFTVNQTEILTLIPYPPFGIPTICFIGLSSYLVLIGLYSASISISTDTELKRAVRKSIPEKYNLLGNIASAKEIQRIEAQTIKITSTISDKITKETGIQPSINEDDIKNYIKEIMEEMKKKPN